MLLRPGGIAAVLVLVLAQVGQAQQAAATAPAAKPASTVDVSRLPLDLGRINRGLRQSATRESRDGLNLRYIIDVYGTAPAIHVLDAQRDNLLHGPAPYGPPTRQEMLQQMTPPEFRAPAADFSALMRWFTDKSK